MSCGADIEAKAIIDALLEGKDITIPTVDMSGNEWDFPTTDIRIPIARLKNSDLTTGIVGGNGTFDVLMKSINNHLADEYSKNRITGAEYTKAYIALVSAALGGATQFLLQRDQSYWQAQLLQIQAVQARVEFEAAKVKYATIKLEALTAQANYALTAMKAASASNEFCLTKNELEVLRPLQAANLTAQGNLIKEQLEVQRAQTSDTRTNGDPVTGMVAKQKNLYTQQVTSYQRDSEVKAAKLFTDAWITQKTIDEGLIAPPGFQNASVDTILTKLKANNGLN